MLRVKITKTRGEFSTPDVLIVEEGTSFKAGTLLDIGVQTWRIRAIHTGEGRTLRGTVDASNIKECICMNHQDRRFEPKTPRERRQAGKKVVSVSIQSNLAKRANQEAGQTVKQAQEEKGRK